LLWMIPLRYLIIAFGIKVMLKGLIFPNSTSFHTRLRIFMSKVPDHEEIKSYALPKHTHSDSLNKTKKQGLPALEWRQDLKGQNTKRNDYDIKHGINLTTKLFLPNQVRELTPMLPTLDYSNTYVPIFEPSESTNLEETREGESNKMKVASELELLSNKADPCKPIITLSEYKDTTPKRHWKFRKWKSIATLSVDQENSRVCTNRSPRIMINHRKNSVDNSLLNPYPRSPDNRRWRWAETETIPRKYSTSS